MDIYTEIHTRFIHCRTACSPDYREEMDLKWQNDLASMQRRGFLPVDIEKAQWFHKISFIYQIEPK